VGSDKWLVVSNTNTLPEDQNTVVSALKIFCTDLMPGLESIHPEKQGKLLGVALWKSRICCKSLIGPSFLWNFFRPRIRPCGRNFFRPSMTCGFWIPCSCPWPTAPEEAPRQPPWISSPGSSASTTSNPWPIWPASAHPKAICVPFWTIWLPRAL